MVETGRDRYPLASTRMNLEKRYLNGRTYGPVVVSISAGTWSRTNQLDEKLGSKS
jgi:hypothetical protein